MSARDGDPAERRSKAMRKPRVGGCHKCPGISPATIILPPGLLQPDGESKQSRGKCPVFSEL